MHKHESKKNDYTFLSVNNNAYKKITPGHKCIACVLELSFFDYLFVSETHQDVRAFHNLVSRFMVFPDDDFACPTMIGMRYDNLNLTGKSN